MFRAGVLGFGSVFFFLLVSVLGFWVWLVWTFRVLVHVLVMFGFDKGFGIGSESLYRLGLFGWVFDFLLVYFVFSMRFWGFCFGYRF